MEVSLLLPVISSALWSLNPAIIYRYAKRAPPFLFTSTRAIFASVFITAVMLLSGVNAGTPPVKAFLLASTSGVVGLALGDVAYTLSIQLLGGSLAAIICYTYMFFAQWFTALLVGEPLGFNAVLGSIVAFAGVTVASYRGEGGQRASKLGILYAFSTAVLWGLSAVFIKAVEEYCDPILVALSRLIPVPLVDTALGLARRENFPLDRGFFAAAAVTGVIGWGVGMVLYVYAIYALGVSTTVIATALTPVLSQFTAKVISGERIPRRVFGGALFVGAGIALQVRPLM